jgi:hypothetical protein
METSRREYNLPKEHKTIYINGHIRILQHLIILVRVQKLLEHKFRVQHPLLVHGSAFNPRQYLTLDLPLLPP